MRVRLVGLMALMALVLAACGGVSPEAGGPSEGIQVHGDWSIEIYNEDGSLDRHVEFSNALRHGGETVTRLLAREISPKIWSVSLAPPPTASSPCTFNQADVDCIVKEATSGGLSVQPIEGDNAGILDVLRLQGQLVADQDGELLSVSTRLQGCAYGDTNYLGCAGVTFGDAVIFSSTDLATPIEVMAGQTVDVTVDLSFASG